MLLKVKTRTKMGQTYLDVYEIGGNHIDLQRPFDPYFYAPSNPYEHTSHRKTIFTRYLSPRSGRCEVPPFCMTTEGIERSWRQPPNQLRFDVLSRKFCLSERSYSFIRLNKIADACISDT